MKRLEFSSVVALFVGGPLTVSCVELFSEVGLEGGPAFGSLRLNGERVECGSIAACVLSTQVIGRVSSLRNKITSLGSGNDDDVDSIFIGAQIICQVTLQTLSQEFIRLDR